MRVTRRVWQRYITSSVRYSDCVGVWGWLYVAVVEGCVCDREQGKEICVHVGPWVSGLTFGCHTCVMVVVCTCVHDVLEMPQCVCACWRACLFHLVNVRAISLCWSTIEAEVRWRSVRMTKEYIYRHAVYDFSVVFFKENCCKRCGEKHSACYTITN